MEHFTLHQFSVATRGGCETMVHGVRTMLNLQPNWVVLQVDHVHNAFNLVSCLAIFQELRSLLGLLIQVFPFVR
jgi:hypothetical protein